MTTFEYSVIPAPKRGLKGRGIKGGEAQFANALTQLMNQAAAEGWHYMRAETLPSEERQGLTGRTTVYQNMLVFRRAVETGAPEATVLAATPHDDPSQGDEHPLLEDTGAQTHDADDAPAIDDPDGPTDQLSADPNVNK